MTSDRFIELLEGYYGPYEREIQRAVVRKYIRRFTEKQLDAIFEELVETFGSQYKAVPDVAAIEKAIVAAKVGLQKDAEGNVYRDGRYLGHYDSGVFIPYLGGLSAEQIRFYSQNYLAYSQPETFGGLLEKFDAERLALPSGEADDAE